MTDETWHLVPTSAASPALWARRTRPSPSPSTRIAALGVEKREVVVSYAVGDNVKITDGYLESFIGTVDELDTGPQQGPRGRIHVRSGNPVELELDQVNHWSA